MSLSGDPPPSDGGGPPLAAVYSFKAKVYKNLQMRLRAKRDDQDKRRKAHLAMQLRKRQQQQQLLQLFILLAADRDRDCGDRCALTALPLDVLYCIIEQVWQSCDSLDRRPEALHALVRFTFDNVREIRSKLFWRDSPLRILEQRERTEAGATLYHFKLLERGYVPTYRVAQRGSVVEEGTRRVKQCCSTDLPRFYYSLIQPMYYCIRGAPESSYGIAWPIDA